MFIGNTKQYITDEFLRECKDHALRFNRGNRTFEQVLKNTIDGELVEIVVCEYFNYTRAEFDISQYDAFQGDRKFEIKHTTKTTEYWSFGDRYKFFLKNAHKLDSIILCYLHESGDVHLRTIADAPSFSDYVRESKYYSGFYYNHHFALRNGHCEVFELNL